jgi:hypothetical protein
METPDNVVGINVHKKMLAVAVGKHSKQLTDLHFLSTHLSDANFDGKR